MHSHLAIYNIRESSQQWPFGPAEAAKRLTLQLGFRTQYVLSNRSKLYHLSSASWRGFICFMKSSQVSFEWIRMVWIVNLQFVVFIPCFGRDITRFGTESRFTVFPWLITNLDRFRIQDCPQPAQRSEKFISEFVAVRGSKRSYTWGVLHQWDDQGLKS